MDDLFPATSMPDRDWWAALWPRPAEVLTDLGIQPHMTVLDLCCGDGYFTAPLARLVDGRVYALDFDAEMIEQAKTEVERLGGTVRQWIEADARKIASLLPGPVDYVLMANTFHGVPDKPDLALAVRHILRPGGWFAIVNWHPIPREQTVVLDQPRGPRTEMRMSPDAVQRIVEPAGFGTVRIQELPPYHYGIILERG
ncbi:class I SAM-dependent methyltransferase [Rhizobium sp. BR 362]|uniref:class I SAM-dependent methyltransferase n=1 Tax=Rhizobium sp. BR 362 TaxID=3040670 RepID=UPI002F3FBD8E